MLPRHAGHMDSDMRANVVLHDNLRTVTLKYIKVETNERAGTGNKMK